MRKAHYTHPPFSVYKESKPARPSLSVSPLSLCLLSLSLSFYMRPIIMLSWVALLLFFFLILRAAWITISCYYLNPRRIRKAMLRQGVSGPEPRFLVGNLPIIATLVTKTTTSDMESVNHDIVGRLMPHYVLWSKTYGTNSHLLLSHTAYIFVAILTYVIYATYMSHMFVTMLTY